MVVAFYFMTNMALVKREDSWMVQVLTGTINIADHYPVPVGAQGMGHH